MNEVGYTLLYFIAGELCLQFVEATILRFWFLYICICPCVHFFLEFRELLFPPLEILTIIPFFALRVNISLSVVPAFLLIIPLIQTHICFIPPLKSSFVLFTTSHLPYLPPFFFCTISFTSFLTLAHSSHPTTFYFLVGLSPYSYSLLYCRGRYSQLLADYSSGGVW